MPAYYNELDPYAAEWLRNLVAAGHIARGDVDERDIKDVHPDDLRGYTQCHFFAGIGIWSHALRRAGWPDDRPVWTGSCPCQPYSAAGRRAGVADERHLWPHWFHLIAERKPPVVLGEQVASKDGLGWLDLVSDDLEGARYAVGASDLCAAGFSGVHIRQRLYFVGVAHHHHPRLEGYRQPRTVDDSAGRQAAFGYSAESGVAARLADSTRERRHWGEDTTGPRGWIGAKDSSYTGWLADANGGERNRLAAGERRKPDRAQTGWNQGDSGAADGGENGWLVDTNVPGEYRWPPSGEQPLRDQCDQRGQESGPRDSGEVDARWAHVDWLLCRNPAGEPSWRPVEPRTFPLDHAIANRMGKLRAYGNGLDAETATQFCSAVAEAIGAATNS